MHDSIAPVEHGSDSSPHSIQPMWDDHCRRVDYLRLAVTDRCNLRCRYCMPAAGIDLTDRGDLLTWEEMQRLCLIMTGLGLRKIRITGGEPFVRKGLLPFLAAAQRLPGRPLVAITTNGTALLPHLTQLRRLGVTRLNVSLDSLRPAGYRDITRRNDFHRVWRALQHATDLDFTLKINMVVLPGLNEEEIPAFVELTRTRHWTVRFIEPMPFVGRGERTPAVITGDEIRRRIENHYSFHSMVNTQSAVDVLYRVPGFQGRVGIIQGHTRSFCGSCSRLRVTAQGQVRTCLYGRPVLDLRALLRDGESDAGISEAIRTVVRRKHAGGVEAEQARCRPWLRSMASIGG